MSACLPGSREPTIDSQPILQAPLTVAALIASAGVIRICVQAMDRIICIEGVGELPGLKSVASATDTPASINARAGAYRLSPRLNTAPGSNTAVTPACFKA